MIFKYVYNAQKKYGHKLLYLTQESNKDKFSSIRLVTL